MKSVFRGHMKAGIDSVRGAKMRNFWTTLGVIIGVASVISVVAIGEGIKQQIGGQIHHLGSNLITVRPAQLRAGSSNSASNASLLSGLSVSGSLTSKDVDTVVNVPGLSTVAPLTILSGVAKGDAGAYDKGFIIGTTSDLPSLLNQSIAEGVFLASDDIESHVAVLGRHAAEQLFTSDVPLGRTFTFHGEEFMVQGIFNDFTTTPLSQQVDFNDAIFIPHAVAEKMTNNTAPTYQILARASKPSDTQKVSADIRQALNKRHGGESGFSVLSGDQNLEADNGILELLTRLIAGVAAISLLVGGIGIMNVMLVSVAERMHEIGIRKAIGATNRQILNQFIIESTLLSLSGGIIGILLSFAIDIGLRLTTDLQPIITWQIVAIATGVSLMVGIIFGTIPAVKAARKDPIEALRSE